jgi:hypothetical protein
MTQCHLIKDKNGFQINLLIYQKKKKLIGSNENFRVPLSSLIANIIKDAFKGSL